MITEPAQFLWKNLSLHLHNSKLTLPKVPPGGKLFTFSLGILPLRGVRKWTSCETCISLSICLFMLSGLGAYGGSALAMLSAATAITAMCSSDSCDCVDDDVLSVDGDTADLLLIIYTGHTGSQHTTAYNNNHWRHNHIISTFNSQVTSSNNYLGICEVLILVYGSSLQAYPRLQTTRLHPAPSCAAISIFLQFNLKPLSKRHFPGIFFRMFLKVICKDIIAKLMYSSFSCLLQYKRVWIITRHKIHCKMLKSISLMVFLV